MQQTKGRTTIHLTMPHIRVNLPTPAAVTIIAFCVFAIAGIVGKVSTTPAAKAPEPIILIATPAPPAIVAPTAIPQAVVFQQQPAQPSKMVVAFAAPSGDVLGPIPMPAASAILGRWGDSWIMVPWQGSNVWVRAADLGLNLANLAPAPQIAPSAAVQAQPVYVAPAPQYQVTNEGPPSPPEPTPAAAQPAVVAAPVVSAPAAAPVQQAATQSLPAAIATITNDIQQSGGQPSPAWRMEHCIGSGAAERCY